MPKPSHAPTVEIINLCRELGFVRSELSGGVCVDLPTWQQFKLTLPPGDARVQIRAFHRVRDYIEGNSRVPDIRRRWKIWHTGTFRVDNRL